jgi:class 3 adenylate cyclase
MNANYETATLAGGCFWCLEAVFDDVKGVHGVESGYAGGHVDNPSYRAVCSGDTGHAQKAVEAGLNLLRVTGYGDTDGPWVPVGVGIHTGKAWVGSIVGASGAGADFTALGDNVNIAARLASNAKSGEVLISDAAYAASGLDLTEIEHRQLELKGKSEPTSVRVLRIL